MARTTSTKSSVDMAVVEENTMTVTDISTEVNIDDVKNKEAENKNIIEELKDYDEINVVSLVPNVSYKDNKSGDMYEWDVIDHVEPMTFETLKNMWRNNKGYFRDMILRPMDDRVIKKFGLTKTYEKYDYLMDESNYTRNNTDKICDAIASTPNGLKMSIVNRIKMMVINGKLSDINIIKAIEHKLNVDLLSFLGQVKGVLCNHAYSV